MNFFIGVYMYTAGALAAKTSSAQGGGHEISLYPLGSMESHRLYFSHPHAGTFRGRVHAEHILKQCHVCVKKRVFSTSSSWRGKRKTMRERNTAGAWAWKVFSAVVVSLSLFWCVRLDWKTKAPEGFYHPIKIHASWHFSSIEATQIFQDP
jgi:hypothetical protein